MNARMKRIATAVFLFMLSSVTTSELKRVFNQMHAFGFGTQIFSTTRYYQLGDGKWGKHIDAQIVVEQKSHGIADLENLCVQRIELQRIATK